MNPSRKSYRIWIIPLLGLILFVMMILIWMIGPVQNQAKHEVQALKQLESKSAFKNCVVQKTNSLSPNGYLISCEVNEDRLVWLNVNEDGNVLNRFNWNTEDYLSSQERLQHQYPNATIYFNIFHDSFVWEIKESKLVLLISLDTETIELKVRQ